MLEQKVLALALTGTTGILWLLVALSVVCLAVAIERALVLAAAGRRSARVDAAVASFATTGDPEPLLAALPSAGTTTRFVVQAVLRALPQGAGTVDMVAATC